MHLAWYSRVFRFETWLGKRKSWLACVACFSVHLGRYQDSILNGDDHCLPCSFQFIVHFCLLLRNSGISTNLSGSARTEQYRSPYKRGLSSFPVNISETRNFLDKYWLWIHAITLFFLTPKVTCMYLVQFYNCLLKTLIKFVFHFLSLLSFSRIFRSTLYSGLFGV